jgi:hypothetical protein
MAPALQELNWCVALVGCSLLSGLFMQSVETAGPDGVREQGPILLCRLSAFDFRWVVPVPGLTGLPSHRIALATS